MRRWTSGDEADLMANYHSLGPRGCAARLGRTVLAVAKKAFYLGITGLAHAGTPEPHRPRNYVPSSEGIRAGCAAARVEDLEVRRTEVVAHYDRTPSPMLARERSVVLVRRHIDEGARWR